MSSTLAPAELMLCYDGTLEGFFCCVFDAYALHCWPRDICETRLACPRLGQELREVATDRAHALRVRAGLERKVAPKLYRQVRTAFLSDAEGREMTLFAYVAKALEEGPRAMGDIACPCVAETRRLVTSVLNERERMFQFLRFEELQGGVFLAQVSPRAKVVPIMMRHFVERFNTQPFIIYDRAHRIAGVWDGKRESLVLTDGLEIPDKTEDERAYQALWKTFYDSVSNEQRFNPELRRSLMPERFWKDMPEMRAALERRRSGE